MLACSTAAYGGSDIGTEGGGDQQCYTKDLPAGVWSLVSYDNAGQPCATKPDADNTCDPAATWDWQLHGTLILNAKNNVRPNTAKVEMQVWVGNGGGSCYGGTSDPIFCDNPTTHYLEESENYFLPSGNMNLAIPFEFLIYETQPWFSYVGDANYFGMWIFVKPSVAAVCESTNYADLVYKDEPN